MPRNSVITIMPPTAIAAGVTNQPSAELDNVPINEAGGNLSVEIIVSAVGGTTPSCIFTIQWSEDNTNWASFAGEASSAITAVGNTLLAIVPIRAPFVRISTNLTGTSPTMTASVLAEAN